MKSKESTKFSELPDKFNNILEAEKVRDCILVSLRGELIWREEHLKDSDILDVVRDAIDIPVRFIEAERKEDVSRPAQYLEPVRTVKTSRILEQIPLHDFTRKSLAKCGMYIPFPK